jgi:hypothetical protein
MTSGKRLAMAVGIGAIVLLGSLSAAQAQYGAPPPPYYPPGPPRGMYRSGLVVGFGLGLGAISTSQDCGPCGGAAGGFEFHVGGMLNPRLALMFDGWGLGRTLDGGGTLTNGMAAVALQYWVNEIIWLKGGVGFAEIRISYDDYYYRDDSLSGLGIMGAAGFEIMQSYNFALDLQLRLAHMSYDFGGANNFALMVGLNWY